jgi:hypothetical protein
MVSALFSIIANRNGKYYVSFVATDGDRDPNPKIAILGPFWQAEKAQREGEKWTKLGERGDRELRASVASRPEDHPHRRQDLHHRGDRHGHSRIIGATGLAPDLAHA